jgi:hypothetical protein
VKRCYELVISAAETAGLKNEILKIIKTFAQNDQTCEKAGFDGDRDGGEALIHINLQN